MNRFAWFQAQSLEEAQKETTATVPEVVSKNAQGETAVIKAGGVDLVDLLKEGIASPTKIVNIRDIPGLDTISYDPKTGLKLGALVTLAQIEASEDIKTKYRALYESVAHAATPQIRNMATLGGNLAQRPRCWYFRSSDHQCLKKGGNKCFAREGLNDIHAIYHTQICPCVHSSSIATALTAFGAQVEILDTKGNKKLVKMEDFFITPDVDVTRENILQAKEIITAVVLPALKAGTKSFHLKQGAKESYDWSLADVAVVMQTNGNTCQDVKIVLGAVSPIPLRATAAEQKIKGQTIQESNAKAAGEAATQGAQPLSNNAYKVPMVQTLVSRAILQAV